MIPLGGDASLWEASDRGFRVCFAMDIHEGPNLPCQMPALDTKGWREGQKPTLSLRNRKERKQMCKPSGRGFGWTLADFESRCWEELLPVLDDIFI